jgi:DNA repair exonuclease SbcCD nuclease subunit
MLKSNRVAIFSDLHLGLYGNSENWHDTALKWAEWIRGELRKQKIKEVFFLGDFFDNRSEISVQTIHVASQIIEMFEEFKLFVIVGNHDAYYKDRSDVHSLGMMRKHSNITLIEKNLEFEAFDKNFLFVPWNNEVPDKPYDYIFGHFEIQTFNMNAQTVCTHGLQPSDLLKGKSTSVFSGHFHTRNSKKYKEGTITYVGSCFSMDFSDVGNTKGYHILDVETGDLEFVENSVSPIFVRLYTSKLKTDTPIDVKNQIVKLIVDEEIDGDILETVKVSISKQSPWQFKVDHNTKTQVTIDNVEVIESIEIDKMFEEFVGYLNLPEDQMKDVWTELSDLLQSSK